MKMPIDVLALLQEATDVEAARSVPLCVSVLLDDTAPDDLTAFVRSSFASASPQARVSVNYFHNAEVMFDPRSDMAVIAAGMTPDIGAVAAQLREAGIPTLVVTTLPEHVNAEAAERGFAIPEGDLVAPDIKDGTVVMLSEPIDITKDDADKQFAYSAFADDPFSLEPLGLTDDFAAELSRKMGEWVVAVFRSKRLAFAQAFDFVRRPLSLESVRATSMQNAGIGFVVFIPGADFPVMTLNQAKMILQIAAAYGQEISAQRVKELAAVVGGGFACRAVARQAVGVVPALGWAIKAGVGYAGTSAMGHAAIEYFEHGGNMQGVAAIVGEARQTAADAIAATGAGQAAQDVAAQAGRHVRDAAFARAKEAVAGAPAKAAAKAREIATSASQAVQNRGTNVVR